MSHLVLPQHIAVVAQLRSLLIEASYCTKAVNRQTAVARTFLLYLERCGLAVADVQSAHVEQYLRCELRRFRQRHGCAPQSLKQWRGSHTAGVHQLLRMVMGNWPNAAEPTDAAEAYAQNLCREFARWLDEARGLAAQTIDDLFAEATRLMRWYRGRSQAAADLRQLAISDVDAYFRERAGSMRRISRKGLAQRLRCFLRFAYSRGQTAHDLGGCLVAPTLYAYEGIPSALSSQQVDAVVRACRSDRSPKGLRDHAIVLLLAHYGLRAGEIACLRLEDIDWRRDFLHVRHAKTDAHSQLPLLPEVGAALLKYLRDGRPATQAREVFIRARAPYRGFATGSSLYTPIRRRLDAAGVQTLGKQGPHAFRHARAVSLLRGGVAPKIISDVLGHRSASSAAAYLKLAIDDLRDVALELHDVLTEEPQ